MLSRSVTFLTHCFLWYSASFLAPSRLAAHFSLAASAFRFLSSCLRRADRTPSLKSCIFISRVFGESASVWLPLLSKGLGVTMAVDGTLPVWPLARGVLSGSISVIGDRVGTFAKRPERAVVGVADTTTVWGGLGDGCELVFGVAKLVYSRRSAGKTLVAVARCLSLSSACAFLPCI